MKKEMALQAKKDMLKKLKGKARKEMHKGLPEGLEDMKSKVIVSADSPEGLKEGLSKAQKILEAKKGEDFGCGGSKGKEYSEGGMPEEDEDKKKKKSRFGLVDSLAKKAGKKHDGSKQFGSHFKKMFGK